MAGYDKVGAFGGDDKWQGKYLTFRFDDNPLYPIWSMLTRSNFMLGIVDWLPTAKKGKQNGDFDSFQTR